MKARVKATGEIIEVKIIDQLSEEEMYVEKFGEMSGRVFHITELDFDNLDYLDYWTRLRHQAAIAAMQSKMAQGNNFGNSREDVCNKIADYCIDVADALIKKLKEKEERK